MVLRQDWKVASASHMLQSSIGSSWPKIADEHDGHVPDGVIVGVEGGFAEEAALCLLEAEVHAREECTANGGGHSIAFCKTAFCANRQKLTDFIRHVILLLPAKIIVLGRF